MGARLFGEPARMFVTTDAAVFRIPGDRGLQLLLVKRANPPFKAHWALPGGFVEEDEDLSAACVRELREETGIRPTALFQLGAWGKPGRDPRGRNVSIAYVTGVRPADSEPSSGSDAEAARWHSMNSLPTLAFDHKGIVTAAARRVRSLARGTHFVYWLLPELFSIGHLRNALKAVGDELVTETEAMAFLKRSRVVKEAATTSREGELYRCVAANLLTPLR
ncbi:MAG: NUDIX domain-containing protein [Planctomycetota bacterium]|jgi:8-oxo-dGTP diphosphatase